LLLETDDVPGLGVLITIFALGSRVEVIFRLTIEKLIIFLLFFLNLIFVVFKVVMTTALEVIFALERKAHNLLASEIREGLQMLE
jgi:hypothetical protein